MSKTKSLIMAALILLTICLFGQTQKKQEVTHSDSLIAKEVGLKAINIYEIVSDSMLVKMSTEQLIDSLTAGRKNSILWLGYIALHSSDLSWLVEAPFHYNITYELVNRTDFSTMFLQKYKDTNIKASNSFVFFELMLSNKFIYDKFTESQKYELTKFTCQKNRFGGRPSYTLLIAKVLEHENIIKIKTKQADYLSEEDIRKEGELTKLVEKLKKYINEKEFLYEK